ncbi:winged helix-turn-helix domain-containing protein [Leclercia sp. LTM14]|uniref:winged helix-turn-helix domain-containing protein n=1 Tax=Leclercia sp. LTM14 TaxID=2870869 RepID=UPI002074658B|nr:winged helix-turn-helix domain-containing protein [Leclercia sp. LTM14]MCM5700487.1 winged helix-turn-helix domain-containing protein [Leclercia sp. LTM14]
MAFTRFIINKEVIFDSDANILHSVEDESIKVTLNAPTARCLKLLLMSNGKVISREEFLAEVWNARGVVVSQNTFYQNISLLRKSLEQAGLSKDIIVTVRQRGFVLASNIEVTPCSNTEGNNEEGGIKERIKKSGYDEEIKVVNRNTLGHEKFFFGKKSVLNIPAWILLVLIVMAAINIILLFFNIII